MQHNAMENTEPPKDTSTKKKKVVTKYLVPRDDFKDRILPISESEGPWYRLNPIKYPSAFHFDETGKGRFDGPNQRYGILYVGEDITGPFIECFGRPPGGKWPEEKSLQWQWLEELEEEEKKEKKSWQWLEETSLEQRCLFKIKSKRPLNLVNLLGDGLVKMGADALVTCGEYSVSRIWAKAIWDHPQQVDGIIYRSRLDNDRICCGLFRHVKDLLEEENLDTLLNLKHRQQLDEILDRYQYALM